jgi:hypothetical protein
MPKNANLYLWRAVEFEQRAKATFDFGQKNAYIALANGYRRLAEYQQQAAFGRVVPFMKPEVLS